MRGMATRRAVAAALAAAAALVAAGCGGGGNDTAAGVVPGRTLTIYSSLPEQGVPARSSRDLVRAEALALAEAHGRAGRFRIRFVPLDNTATPGGSWDPAKTSVNARTAVRDATTIAYLGDAPTEATAVSLPILNEGGILQVAPTLTYPGLTREEGAAPGEPDRYYPSGQRTFGRVIPTDDVEAAALATAMREDGCVEAAVIDDPSPGDGLAPLVAREARGLRVKVLRVDRVPDPPAGSRQLAEQVERSDADCLFVGAGADEQAIAALLRRLRDARPSMLFFGPAALARGGLLPLLPAAVADALRITTPMLPPQAWPRPAQRFFRAFAQRYGRAPSPEAVFGYEAMNAVLYAIEEAGELGNHRAEVIKQFFAIKDRRSVLGTYDIDEDGDTTLSVFAVDRVRGGRLVFDRVVRAEPA
jgi:branched-chain amino acid transport system substrate-binding protein